MSHTPGPWTAMCDEARGKPRCLITDSAGYQVAEINPFREPWNENARLIAAAPELLQVLKNLVEAVEFVDPGVYCLDEMKEAIAKAEGANP